MNFEQCYEIIKKRLYETDLSKIDSDFSAVISFTGNEKGDVYMAYIGGKKIIEPVKHTRANIFVSLSTETFEGILKGQLEPFKAFTTGKIKAKGNVFLAMSLYKKLLS